MVALGTLRLIIEARRELCDARDRAPACRASIAQDSDGLAVGAMTRPRLVSIEEVAAD